MPIIPIFNDEPLSSLMGVMRFPNDMEKAAAYASWRLAKGSKGREEDATVIGASRMHRIAVGAAEHSQAFEETRRAEIGGAATGEVVKTLFALISSNPEVASWEHAIQIVEKAAARDRAKTRRSVAVSPTALRQYLAQFAKVLHFWGAWSIRGREWFQDASVGYSLPIDVEMFISEAEILSRILRQWDNGQTTKSKYLAGDTFGVGHDWRPPSSKEGWPRTGVLPVLQIDVTAVPELAKMRNAGRPRRKTG